MNVRAKFMLQEHRVSGYGRGHRQHTFIFRPLYDSSIPEDRRFAAASPSGEMSVVVDNPAVIAEWEGKQGTQFYLDLVPVPVE